MPGSHAGKENIIHIQHHFLYFSLLAVIHFYCAVQHHKHLFAVVDVPAVRFISPMQSDAGGVLIEINPGQVRFESVLNTPKQNVDSVFNFVFVS